MQIVLNEHVLRVVIVLTLGAIAQWLCDYMATGGY
jgi:hypothetical protein